MEKLLRVIARTIDCEANLYQGKQKEALTHLSKHIYSVLYKESFKSLNVLDVIKALVEEELIAADTLEGFVFDLEEYKEVHEETIKLEHLYDAVMDANKSRIAYKVEKHKENFVKELEMHCGNCNGKSKCLQEIRACENMPEITYQDWVMQCRFARNCKEIDSEE